MLVEEVVAPTVLVHTNSHAYSKMTEPTLAYGSPALLRVIVLVERLDWRERFARGRRSNPLWVLPGLT